TGFGMMDDLTYSYAPNTNMLMKVADTGNTAHGFIDGTNTSDDYVYDANGNMVLDRNKGITGITYNHLNLPITVNVDNFPDVGSMSYTYNASGTKLKKTVSGTSSGSMEYAGNY